MTKKIFILFEHASGYALIKSKAKSSEDLYSLSVVAGPSYEIYSKSFRLYAFSPFVSAANALDNCNAVSEGIVHDDLRSFLHDKLPLFSDVTMAVAERKLAESLKAPDSDFPEHLHCLSESSLQDVYRTLRLHFPSFISGLSHFMESQAQIGLGHSYSRAKVKFNINRSDNMIIQSINLLDQIDKDVNSFTMRIKEWFSYHFPELAKIVPENGLYLKVIGLIKDRSGANESRLEELEELLSDGSKAHEIVEAAKTSMGMDLTESDSDNLVAFSERVINLLERRAATHNYLVSKLDMVAPNLSTLIGTQVSARLIARAGSLTNLAKFPASTIQILGAEKALFRALRFRGNTPKYGLLYHSSFIGRASKENKGRISRFLAAKCAIASRIDCFSENLCDVFGIHLKKQVEDRLSFFDTGIRPVTNAEAMTIAVQEANRVVRKLKKRAIAIANKASTNKSDAEEPLPTSEIKRKRKVKRQDNGVPILEPQNISEANLETDGLEPSPKKKKKRPIQLVSEEGNSCQDPIAVDAEHISPDDLSISKHKVKKDRVKADLSCFYEVEKDEESNPQCMKKRKRSLSESSLIGAQCPNDPPAFSCKKKKKLLLEAN